MNNQPVKMPQDPAQYIKQIELDREKLPKPLRCTVCDELLELINYSVNIPVTVQGVQQNMQLSVACLVCKRPHAPDMKNKYFTLQERTIIG